MQAALFEGKAALAAALVEMYKKTDMKKAHVQYALEKKYWAKSQKLVLEAANAHPLPNKHVAKSAVSGKVKSPSAALDYSTTKPGRLKKCLGQYTLIHTIP